MTDHPHKSIMKIINQQLKTNIWAANQRIRERKKQAFKISFFFFLVVRTTYNKRSLEVKMLPSIHSASGFAVTKWLIFELSPCLLLGCGWGRGQQKGFIALLWWKHTTSFQWSSQNGLHGSRHEHRMRGSLSCGTRDEVGRSVCSQRRLRRLGSEFCAVCTWAALKSDGMFYKRTGFDGAARQVRQLDSWWWERKQAVREVSEEKISQDQGYV